MILLAFLASVTIPLPTPKSWQVPPTGRAPAKPSGPPADSGVRYQACLDQVKTDPAGAVLAADHWRINGGGWGASQCLGLAYVAQNRWGPAEASFEQAAQDAEQKGDGRAANLWVQAGNAALAASDPAKARMALDRAIALPVLDGLMKGEAWMDRARADVALGDLPTARGDLDKAIALAPADPMGWLLSATLDRRQHDLPRAAKDIAEARTRAPTDPDVALEAGNIAAAAGDAAKARVEWQHAHDADPNGDTGREAAALLDAQPPALPTPGK